MPSTEAKQSTHRFTASCYFIPKKGGLSPNQSVSQIVIPTVQPIRQHAHDLEREQRRLLHEMGKALFVDGHHFAGGLGDCGSTADMATDQGEFPQDAPFAYRFDIFAVYRDFDFT